MPKKSSFNEWKYFRKIKGLSEFPESANAIGDVLSHLICSTEVGPVHVSMLRNPSHLEIVNPVSMGKTRAKQMAAREGDYGDGSTEFGTKIINIQASSLYPSSLNQQQKYNTSLFVAGPRRRSFRRSRCQSGDSQFV